MAMGGKGRRVAESAIASCRPFRNSTGSLTGTRGSTRELGWLSSHPDARRIRELLSRAVYVVWSYNTPIAFVSEDEDGNRTSYYVDEPHSPTTANHQGIARMGMGEYETIGSATRRERERANRRSAGPQRAVFDRQAAEAAMAFAEGTVLSEFREQLVGRSVRPVRDDSALVAAVGPDRSLVDSPGYQNGLTEDQQASTLARLLDPRYANPDWVPDRDFVQLAADADAERRDEERVEREGQWRL